MQVYVLNKHGQPLIPCSPARARQLFEAGKAKVLKRTPIYKNSREKAHSVRGGSSQRIHHNYPCRQAILCEAGSAPQSVAA